MKILRTLVIIWGFVVVLVLPVLLWISHLSDEKFFTFQEYIISVLLFLLATYMLLDRSESRKASQ